VKADAPILTVAIPTYNRAGRLQAQLERLLPQLRPEVHCCVYDNASPDGTRGIAERYRDRGIAYVRSEYNCGAGRNFFRCFEECRTEWLWILGDDDPIADHAVADLLATLRHQTCDFIHTSTPLCRYASDVVVKDIPSLFEHTNFGALLWISAGIYRTSSFRPLFRLFNESISTWGPQLIVVLSLLESHGGKVLLSSVVLISKSPTGAGWSTWISFSASARPRNIWWIRLIKGCWRSASCWNGLMWHFWLACGKPTRRSRSRNGIEFTSWRIGT
jgi:glycosyltransferase involved in cell wall biosynthesis